MKQSSAFLNLNWQDFAKGLIMSVLGAIGAVVQSSFAAGVFTLDWESIWQVAMVTGVAYIMKQLFTPTPAAIEVDTSKTKVVELGTNKTIIDKV